MYDHQLHGQKKILLFYIFFFGSLICSTCSFSCACKCVKFKKGGETPFLTFISFPRPNCVDHRLNTNLPSAISFWTDSNPCFRWTEMDLDLSMASKFYIKARKLQYVSCHKSDLNFPPDLFFLYSCKCVRAYVCIHTLKWLLKLYHFFSFLFFFCFSFSYRIFSSHLIFLFVVHLILNNIKSSFG